MSTEDERERTGPTDEVGSEGGSPGDIDLDRTDDVLVGSNATQNVVPADEHVHERDREKTRDDRPRP